MELKDSRKFALNLLATVLAILATSGSKVFQPAVLVLLIYTISLRLAINTCFLQNYPVVSTFLHVIPLLAASCTAGVKLVFDVQSFTLAAVGVLLGVLLLLTLMPR